jgi:pyruvate formate-lyase/glycerol dehydratase family glycyl radical enzyme
LNIKPSDRICSLRKKTLSAKRFLSLEQAKIITEVYRQNEDKPVIIKRAMAFEQSLLKMPIAIDPEELIVGNRTPDIRAGVVFPEAGINWLIKEIETIHERPQDPFNVRKKDIEYFHKNIVPFWSGKTLEDEIYSSFGNEIAAIEKVVKINQKDHAQGHICPDVAGWLTYGPSGLLKITEKRMREASPEQIDFFKSVCITLNAAVGFISRYSVLAAEMAVNQKDDSLKNNLTKIGEVCNRLALNPPESFREALQSVWFLFVILQMESNASSFSPGRMDQYLYPFFANDIKQGKLNNNEAVELIDSLFIKFNHIVYMRNAHSAEFFAGFPIGFNITLGGQLLNGVDASNELSFLFLKAQDHCRLPQPNLTARLHKGSPESFINECTLIIGLGTGMPQIANDSSIIPSLENSGIDHADAVDYALVGCVELTTHGNYLGWSDAAMFNLVKVLELTLNDGKCMLTGRQLGLNTGFLTDYKAYHTLEEAYKRQIDFFIDKMLVACNEVERCHQLHLPSPFLSSVINNCILTGTDVTAGGAKYNLSGIQAIQVANVADSLAVLKELVFGKPKPGKEHFLNALLNNFGDDEFLRQLCINKIPKYGNDVEWVDALGAGIVKYFANRLNGFTNYRGGKYHMGLYTVSAHVPMGVNVAATPDGRLAGTPLADGGLSPMSGRDITGPTAVLNSVMRMPAHLAGNGTLLNMKFLPSFFKNEKDLEKFSSLLKTIISLPIHHVQFNVVKNEDLIKAKADPESYRDLTIRVAGYTAYFTELTQDLQDEIIDRTTYG